MNLVITCRHLKRKWEGLNILRNPARKVRHGYFCVYDYNVCINPNLILMKKRILSAILLSMTLLFTLASCRETADKTKEAAAQTEEALEDAADDVKDATEEAAEAVEEAAEEAVEKTGEAIEEMDEDVQKKVEETVEN